jgi:hypothetical protein
MLLAADAGWLKQLRAGHSVSRSPLVITHGNFYHGNFTIVDLTSYRWEHVFPGVC